jgi:hypothetical protein
VVTPRWNSAARSNVAASGWLKTQHASSRTCRFEDALHLYAERGSPKYEKAAMRWLTRYLTEGEPRLQHFAEIVSSLAKLEPVDR